MEQRQIKFRAFIKKTNRIVDVIGIELDPEFGGVYVWGKAYQGHDDGEHEADKDFYTWAEIDLMQFIGRHDRNNKEVYERDVIEYDNPNYGYGDPKEPRRLRKGVPSIFDLYDDDVILYQIRTGEVIGNVCEHGNLL